MHVWCKFGDSSSNMWQVIMRIRESSRTDGRRQRQYRPRGNKDRINWIKFEIISFAGFNVYVHPLHSGNINALSLWSAITNDIKSSLFQIYSPHRSNLLVTIESHYNIDKILKTDTLRLAERMRYGVSFVNSKPGAYITKAKRRLTYWVQDKMAAISQMAFLNAFSWMKMYKFPLMFHLSLFLRVKLIIFQHWFR